MATQDEMLEALEQLKMLSGEGMFENKELFGFGGKKVAPTNDAATHDARTQALQTHEEALQALKRELDVFKSKLDVQKEDQRKRNEDLDKRESLLHSNESILEGRISMNKTIYTTLHLLQA